MYHLELVVVVAALEVVVAPVVVVGMEAEAADMAAVVVDMEVAVKSFFTDIHRINNPGTLDAGDVMMVYVN